MGETETPYFYDFGTLGRVPGSQNQLFLSSETHLKWFKTNPDAFSEHIIWGNIQSVDLKNENVWKDGRRQFPSRSVL